MDAPYRLIRVESCLKSGSGGSVIIRPIADAPQSTYIRANANSRTKMKPAVSFRETRQSIAPRFGVLSKFDLPTPNKQPLLFQETPPCHGRCGEDQAMPRPLRPHNAQAILRIFLDSTYHRCLSIAPHLRSDCLSGAAPIPKMIKCRLNQPY
ncbi:MAG TPA: hypothetical protein VNS34_12715 [Rhizobiaceae bacterium]|nr:hypothetical protein [Rhizobiaceae bacterium]